MSISPRPPEPSGPLRPTAGTPPDTNSTVGRPLPAEVSATIRAADGTVLATVSRRRHPAAPGEPGPVVVIAVAGDLDLDTAPLAEATLIQTLDTAARVCLDLSAVRFFGAAGVRVVHAARRHAEAVGHEFRLAGVGGLTERVLRITGLYPPA